MFFGASGSIAGGQMYAGRHASDWRDVLRAVEDRCVVAREPRREEVDNRGWAPRGRCGTARSSAAPRPERIRSSAAGCGSWTMTKSYSSVESSAFNRL